MAAPLLAARLSLTPATHVAGNIDGNAVVDGYRFRFYSTVGSGVANILTTDSGLHVLRSIGVTIGLVLTLTAGVVAATQRSDVQPSAIVSQQEAQRQDFDWGTLYTYYQKETYGTRDPLAAVAVIKPGWEIHPPHQHAEEEYLMVVEGNGTWYLNGREREARPGDMQYAAPWDVHGIKNTGSTPLRFVVWKWNSKGVVPLARPAK